LHLSLYKNGELINPSDILEFWNTYSFFYKEYN
jgi:hypothetical protein